MLVGFMSDSFFCTPSSDSLFKENTNEEDWNCLPAGTFRVGSRELLGEAVSQFHKETQDFCSAVVLILGMKKEKPSAKKHNVHSLESSKGCVSSGMGSW